MIFEGRNNNLIKNLRLFSISLILTLIALPTNILSNDQFPRESELNNANIKGEYLLDTGDELGIYFKDVEAYSNIYEVDMNGDLYLPDLKEYSVRGKTLKEVKEDLKKKYAKYIKNPELEVKIYSYRRITIFVSGEVKNPGIYTFPLSPKSSSNSPPFKINNQKIYNNPELDVDNQNIFEIIKSIGGVTNYAKLSDVTVIRENSISQGGGKIKTKVDLLSLILNGDLSQNIRILDGDSIIIPKSNEYIRDQIISINKTNISPDQIVVYVTGNVNSPGKITLRKGSSLNQAIASSGGKKTFTGNIEFIRFENDGRTLKKVFKHSPNAKINSSKNPILMDGDIINTKKTVFGKASRVITDVGNPIISGYGLYKIFTD